ncbi:hypothetical protein [Acrocarpospora sp. B8E8]|uniref:hypothetical protein n=1 Tax=Acrocarpospora sp. B8E8 TaxID=3153572 RepID=UPI00325CC142
MSFRPEFLTARNLRPAQQREQLVVVVEEQFRGRVARLPEHGLARVGERLFADRLRGKPGVQVVGDAQTGIISP